MNWTAPEITGKVKAIAEKYGSQNPQQFKQLLRRLGRVEPDESCRGLLDVFRVDDYESQQLAGLLLTRLNPQCQEDLEKILQSVLATWNLSVEELPFYLRKQFGRSMLLGILDAVERETKDERALRAIETFRYWLGAAKSHKTPDG